MLSPLDTHISCIFEEKKYHISRSRVYKQAQCISVALPTNPDVILQNDPATAHQIIKTKLDESRAHEKDKVPQEAAHQRHMEPQSSQAQYSCTW